MNTRVFAMNDVATVPLSGTASESLKAVATYGFVFVTYAVEIEGEAPLYFSIEAVDE